MDELMDTAEKQMKQALSVLEEDLSTIRTGRANPQILESLKIEAYENTAPLMLSELATITASDAKTLVITPFDPSTISRLEQGIQKANLGVSCVINGSTIHVAFPPMTEERRKEYIKLASKKAEGVHVMIRQARQEAINAIRKKQQENELSEDEQFRLEKQVQQLTDTYTNRVNEILKEKINELSSM